MRAPAVLWFTGLSGAGKSTLATAVERALHAHAIPTELLDGDAVRALSPTGFSRAERDAHVQRVGFLASRLEHHGVTVLCALISPYAEARRTVRSMCRVFLEIYVSTPLADFAPVHAPLAVQLVASVDDHVSVVELPMMTVDAPGVTVAVGAAGGAFTATVAAELAVPPVPVHVNE